MKVCMKIWPQGRINNLVNLLSTTPIQRKLSSFLSNLEVYVIISILPYVLSYFFIKNISFSNSILMPVSKFMAILNVSDFLKCRYPTPTHTDFLLLKINMKLCFDNILPFSFQMKTSTNCHSWPHLGQWSPS